MKQIKASNCELMIIVDDEDYDEIVKNNKKWSVTFYKGRPECVRTSIKLEGVAHKWKTITIGRFILGNNISNDLECDHVDRNPLNNLRSNLRAVSSGFNRRNREMPNKSSGLIGVKKIKSINGKQYLARITAHRNLIHLGSFYDKNIAARIRDLAVVTYQLHGSKFNNPV